MYKQPEKFKTASGNSKRLKIQVSVTNKKTRGKQTTNLGGVVEFKTPEKRKSPQKLVNSGTKMKAQTSFSGLVPKPMATITNKSQTV